MRRLFMQALECRCVMDASAFEMGMEVFHDMGLEAAVMSQPASLESSDEASTGDEPVGETFDPDSVVVICDLPTIDLSELGSSVEAEGDVSDAGEDGAFDLEMYRKLYSRDLADDTIDGVPMVISGYSMAMSGFVESDIVESNFVGDADVLEPIAVGSEGDVSDAGADGAFDLEMFREMSSRDSADDAVDDMPIVISGNPMAMSGFIESDIGERNLVGDADVLEPIAVNDESVFVAFGAASENEDHGYLIEPTAFRGITFNFDVDQNGNVSRLDAEMLISYLSDFFSSEYFAAFAESNSSEMLQMDVDGDAQLTPLDALIVINELNRSGALEANVSSGSSRVATNSALIASQDLRIRDMSDDYGAEAASLDEVGISDESMTDVFGKMSIARMTDLAILDFAPSFEASRLAGYKSLTLAKQDGTPFLVSVDDNGKVSAVSGTQDLEVSIGEDQLISVDGESSGLAVVDLGGDFLLSKQTEADIALMFA